MPPTPKKDEYPLPEGYEDASPEWNRAFQHAKRHDNPDKTAILFADAHAQDEEFSK